VFDVMLQKAIRLCEATHGHFFNYDGESFHLGAVGDDAPYVEFMRQVGAVLRWTPIVRQPEPSSKV
jgi:hypothetical protein